MNPFCRTRAEVIHVWHARGPSCPFPPKAMSPLLSCISRGLLALYRDTTAHSGGISRCLRRSDPCSADTLKRGGVGTIQWIDLSPTMLVLPA